MSSSSEQKQTQSNTGTSSSTTDPWAVQTPYLTQAFSGAANALGQAQGGGVAPTGFTAQLTPDQIASYQKQLGYGTNSGIADSSAAAGAAASAAGAGGLTQGLYGLANYAPQGTTQSNIDAATQYANNPAIPGMVAAAMRGAVDTANEQTLPGIGRQAAAGGNINSSRTAIQQGIVQRGLQTDAANVDANLRGAAYNQGLTLAEQQAEAQNTNRLAALTGLTTGGNSALTAGTGANSGSVAQQGGLYDIANTGSSGLTAGAQAGLTNQQQAYDFSQSAPFKALQQYYNLVGANNWGGTTSGTTTGTQQGTATSTPSIYQTIGGLMSGGASLAKTLTGGQGLAGLSGLFGGGSGSTPSYQQYGNGNYYPSF